MDTLRILTRNSVTLFALATLAGPARADAAAADTAWGCWYNGDTTFRCRLARAPDEEVSAPGGHDAPAPGASPFPPAPSQRLLLPRRGPLPVLVQTIHEHPARLRGRTITIPLFSHPTDAQLAAELTHAVMCGDRPACHVQIFRSAAAFAYAHEEDPALE
jgi:hypothetical protein